MQSIQKKIFKLAVVIALFSSVAFAEGEMGGGGLWGNGPGPTKAVVTTPDETQAISGPTTAASESEFGLDWLMSSIAQFLGIND